jgi:hypothetical protein
MDHKKRILELEQLVAKAIVNEYRDILAGNIDVGIAEPERLAIAKQLPTQALKQVLLLTRSRTIAETLVPLLEDGTDLIDLCLSAKSVYTRKNAALAISDKSLLIELYKQVRDKDKTVFKTVHQRLDSLKQSTETSSADESTEPDSGKVGGNIATKNVGTAKKPPLAIQLNPEIELHNLKKEISRLSFKNIVRLNAARNKLSQIHKRIDKSSKELDGLTETIHSKISEMFEKNRTHQKQLKENTLNLLKLLKDALDEGRSHEALPAWDKIQGNISNTSGKSKAVLRIKANQFKNKLNDLRDWKTFAVTEKKKELIKQMQRLAKSRMHASDRSRYITAMHKEWKSLDLSDQNETLWKEFKQFSDQAYEPCKVYFKERKQLMASNLRKRREICVQLEKYLAELNEQTVNISQLNKLLIATEKEWEIYAPVEQSKIKSLQKRYYGVLKHLRRLRKISQRNNTRKKLELIAQAQKLVTVEDEQKAMNEAKQLQQSWKKIGPTSYKDDKKYWESFRSACDKIFAAQTQAAAALKETLERADKILAKVAKSLDSLLELDDDSFRVARSEFQDLTQQFFDSLSPEVRKRRGKIINRFNNIKKKIDARYKTLPNKKYQQLKDSILAKAQLLEVFEQKLLNSKDQIKFTQIKNSLNKSSWESIKTSVNTEYDLTLQSRLQQLLDAESRESLLKLARIAEQDVRRLCIELEVRANIETPKEDQAMRMQIQLEQLKNGFGQRKPNQKENARYAMGAELHGFCIGPVEDIAQNQLPQRLARAIKKLL